jgi:hypothetical protein
LRNDFWRWGAWFGVRKRLFDSLGRTGLLYCVKKRRCGEESRSLEALGGEEEVDCSRVAGNLML